jgi:hypothetical protein
MLTYRRRELEKGYGPGRRVNLHGERRYGRDHTDGRLGSQELVRLNAEKLVAKLSRKTHRRSDRSRSRIPLLTFL